MKRTRNLAKLMARLNPKSLNLRGTSGGIPEITTEDIAGALGLASRAGPGPRLAVLVVALRWWPGLMEGVSKTVSHRKIVHRFKPKKGSNVVRIPWVEKIPIEAPAETSSFQYVADIIATKLRSRIMRHYLPESAPRTRGDVKLRMPDSLFHRFDSDLPEQWARVVIAEYRHPNHCPTCTPWGRAGQVPTPVEQNGKIIEVRWDPCPKCAAAGALAWGSGRRAKALGLRRIDFANHLNHHHEGALTLLRELEWRGVRFIKRCL